MKRSPKRADACGDGREEVRLRAANHSHGRCRAVLFMIGVQDEENIQCSRDIWVNDIGFSRLTEHHAKEVSRVTQ